MEVVHGRKLSVLYGLIVFIMLFILVINTPSTSLPKKAHFHSQFTEMMIGSNQDIILRSNNATDSLSLSSLRLSGEIYGLGDVIVTLKAEAPGWAREYLVFSNRKMVLKKTEGMSSITMFAVQGPGAEIITHIVSPASGSTHSEVLPVKIYYMTTIGNVNRIEFLIDGNYYDVSFPQENEGYVDIDINTRNFLNGEYELYAKLYVETIEQRLGGYPFPTITVTRTPSRIVIFDNVGVEDKPEEDDEGIGFIITDGGDQGGNQSGGNGTNVTVGNGTGGTGGGETGGGEEIDGGQTGTEGDVPAIPRELIVEPVIIGESGIRPASIEEYEGLRIVGMSITDLPFDPVVEKGDEFDNECLETCLIERAPSEDTTYTLSINVTNGTYLKLGNIIYLEYKPVPPLFT